MNPRKNNIKLQAILSQCYIIGKKILSIWFEAERLIKKIRKLFFFIIRNY